MLAGVFAGSGFAKMMTKTKKRKKRNAIGTTAKTGMRKTRRTKRIAVIPCERLLFLTGGE
jgi:hypothetical protein